MTSTRSAMLLVTAAVAAALIVVAVTWGSQGVEFVSWLPGIGGFLVAALAVLVAVRSSVPDGVPSTVTTESEVVNPGTVRPHQLLRPYRTLLAALRSWPC